MAKAVPLNEVYKPKFRNYDGTSVAAIICDKGECYVNSPVELSGIEIKYKGPAIIKPALPEGWVLRGNGGHIIIFGLNGVPIKDSLLFTYTGIIKIKNTLASSPKGERVSSGFEKNLPYWKNEGAIGTFDIDTTNWGDMKDNRKSGSVRRNQVNIPIKGGLKTDGGLYYLGEREYKGAYHIHEDLGVAMTESTYNKHSKILSKEPTKMKETKSRRRSYSRGSRGGGY